MRPAEIKSYVPSFEVGKPLENFAVVEVLRSENEKFSKGQKLYGYSKFQTYSVRTQLGLAIQDSLHSYSPVALPRMQVIPKAQADNLRVLENKEQLPWTTWVGSAGMPGQTAWYGLKFIGKPQKGETVFVSGAMGPVGQVTIALAHASGCKVIASAGSEEKVKYLREELKVERVFNYKVGCFAAVGRQGADVARADILFRRHSRPSSPPLADGQRQRGSRQLEQGARPLHRLRRQRRRRAARRRPRAHRSSRSHRRYWRHQRVCLFRLIVQLSVAVC